MKPDPNESPANVTEDELHALVDARLDPAQRSALQARLAQDPQALATSRAWQQQREALAGLHREMLGAEVPAALAAAARQASVREQQSGRWWRWGGMAAGVLCAFGLGWMSHGRFAPAAGGALAQLAAQRSGVREFVHQASVAHMVYAPEVRHPVEVTAAQQEHLVQWLSKRLQRPLKVPDLSAEGYELVGGRLLPGSDGARAQFMFQDKAGERITLYLGAMKAAGASPALISARPTAPAALPPVADVRESAFSFSDEGPVPGFYWVEQGFGYALTGKLSREQLMRLAQAVYRQL
ncbi:MAG: anti-sigma factor [Betaproteobacteria bacterium]